MNTETLSPIRIETQEKNHIDRNTIRRVGAFASKKTAPQEVQEKIHNPRSAEVSHGTETEIIGQNERTKETIEHNIEKNFIASDLNKEEILVVIKAKKDGEEIFYAQRNNDVRHGNKSLDDLYKEIGALTINDSLEESQTLIYMPDDYKNNIGSEITSESLKSIASLLKGSKNVQFSTFKPTESKDGLFHNSFIFNYRKDGKLQVSYNEEQVLDKST